MICYNHFNARDSDSAKDFNDYYPIIGRKEASPIAETVGKKSHVR